MLIEPTGLIDIDSNGSVPRLLVDTSGDCAIAINPSSQFEAISVQHGGNSEAKKTSNLVRLPQSAIPSGYAPASEVREVQFLAPRPARHFDVDVLKSFHSVQNDLCLYPKLLKVKTKALRKFAVRV